MYRCFSAEGQMDIERLKGRGRLVPTPTTGLKYQVDYEIHLSVSQSKPGKRRPPNNSGATKCRVQSAHNHLIPDGRYFLHADLGQIHQLKSADRKWHYLATR